MNPMLASVKLHVASCLAALLAVALIPSAAFAQAEAGAAAPSVSVRQGVPPPGRYRIESRSSGKCLGWVVAGVRQPFLGLMRTACSNDPRADLRASGRGEGPFDHASVYIVPITSSTMVIVDHGECLTRARGVLIGAPSIDYVNCGEGHGYSVLYNGLAAVPEDQRFRMSQSADGAVRIYPLGLFSSRTLPCFTVRDNGTNPGTDVISWACHAGADQEFDLIWMGPLSPALQREYDAAMAAERIRRPEPEPPAILPRGGLAGVSATGGALAPAKLGGLRAAPSLAGTAALATPQALRAALQLPPPARLAVAQGFSLDTGMAVTQATLEVPHNRAAWQLAVPYRFAVEGITAALIECSLYDAEGARIGERAQRVEIAGPSAGTLLFGVPRSDAASTAPAASSECFATLGGVREGIDWEAWTFASPAAASGWDVFVKEAGKSRFWTGAPFLPGFSLRATSGN